MALEDVEHDERAEVRADRHRRRGVELAHHGREVLGLFGDRRPRVGLRRLGLPVAAAVVDDDAGAAEPARPCRPVGCHPVHEHHRGAFAGRLVGQRDSGAFKRLHAR